MGITLTTDGSFNAPIKAIAVCDKCGMKHRHEYSRSNSSQQCLDLMLIRLREMSWWDTQTDTGLRLLCQLCQKPQDEINCQSTAYGSGSVTLARASCDCGDSIWSRSEHASEARREVRQHMEAMGWVVVGGRPVCKRCQQRIKPPVTSATETPAVQQRTADDPHRLNALRRVFPLGDWQVIDSYYRGVIADLGYAEVALRVGKWHFRFVFHDGTQLLSAGGVWEEMIKHVEQDIAKVFELLHQLKTPPKAPKKTDPNDVPWAWKRAGTVDHTRG